MPLFCYKVVRVIQYRLNLRGCKLAADSKLIKSTLEKLIHRRERRRIAYSSMIYGKKSE